jgi:hypothetical protein
VRVAPRRAARLRANVFEALIAVLAVFSCVGFFFDPPSLAQTAVAQATGNASVEWAWNVGYGAAGVLILVGLLAFIQHIRAAGLVLLAAASLMQTVAAILSGELTTFTEVRLAAIFAVAAAAALVRAHMLVTGEDVIVVRTVKDLR